MKIVPDSVRPGQESVWSYPRPAVAEVFARRLKIVHRGIIVADTRKGVRTLETSHPPSYYFPPSDIAAHVLKPTPRRSLCEWKGEAVYFDVEAGGETLHNVAWSYPDPEPGFKALRGYVAFYAWPFDQCWVDDERATPQPGNFYGGWVTPDIAGPFKGGPGTMGW